MSLNIVEPTPAKIAEMIALSGVGGHHDGHTWDVKVTAVGAVVEIEVTPYDVDSGDEARGWKRRYTLAVKEVTS